MRALIGVTVAALLLGALGGCSDPGSGGTDDAERINQLEDDVDAARDGVVHEIAAAVEAPFAGGTRRHSSCGESYAPRGVRIVEHLRFDPGPLGVEATVSTVAEVLEDGGWDVEWPANPAIVLGRLGDIEVRAVAGAVLQVDISNPDCVETGDDSARDFADRPSSDVDWPAGPTT
ncbi:hypothetical protein ACFQ0K_11175 [Nocardioides caeni]|uniref:Uncharacterized protein n=1 Tax=Nocardioides caeni TaxID=574700 RepID=A0A4S8NLX0_9ACTN|nr:hypothetical protein [Nocardioides caeni]THV17977.1 hypothetical protein E9934_05895 [Nocardioides caeni]